jgi:hypothetical protein
LTVNDDFRFTVDGKQLSVHDLKAGMKGTATVTTKTTVTPVTVTEIKNGTVMQASGPSIIVKTDQGIKMFSQGDVDKRGVKIVRNGQPAVINDFHQGDQISATIITTHPPHVMTEKQVNATLAKAGAAPAAAASAGPAPAAPMAPAEPTAAKKLPKTASMWPSLWLASVLSLGLGIFLTLRRRALI